MNTQILQKCIDELKKDKPNLDYIRGILETVVEMVPVPSAGVPIPYFQTLSPQAVPGVANTAQPELSPEEAEQIEFMKQYVGGPVATVQ